ncbi:hypothetical protein EMPS_07250 [Entomortierella parvispora]|uniref:Cytochrome P450 n=1 Tax=Entomortierella parvispora TaxID=205924 RepID=A0A9P3HE00_9FUNG|nr:hypothetical protein EMPS_07250 [Entomortierella parvispora]
MAMIMAWIGVKRLIERQMSKKKRTPLEYAVLATLGFLAAATLKYPNRAFLTSARKRVGYELPGFALVGSLPHIVVYRDDPLPIIQSFFEEHGDVLSFTLPVYGRAILINNPEHMEHIFKTNFENYVKGNVFRWQLKDILGRGIFVADGEEWRFHRKTASNIFTTKLYRSLVQNAFKSSAHDFCQHVQTFVTAQKPVDLQAKFHLLTMDAFGKLTFGIEFKALTQEGSNEFGDAFDFLTSAADARISNPIWFITDRLIPGRRKKHLHCIHTLDCYAAAAVAKRRAETEEVKASRQRDLLDHFISYRKDDGSLLDERELRDVFVNFMVAGRDTTAQALTWQFYSLMANPRVMKNLVQEIDSVLQGTEENISYETLMNSMPYAKAVLHETLRLNPPVPKNVRQALDNDTLPDGTQVNKGDFIGYSNWCMGRNKSVWGQDADLFVPERWLVPDPTADPTSSAARFGKFRAESQFKFISFNAGPRLCLGQTFAILEAMVTTCILLQRYEFKLVPRHPTPRMKGSVTLPMKDPLMTIVSERPRSSRLPHVFEHEP